MIPSSNCTTSGMTPLPCSGGGGGTQAVQMWGPLIAPELNGSGTGFTRLSINQGEPTSATENFVLAPVGIGAYELLGFLFLVGNGSANIDTGIDWIIRRNTTNQESGQLSITGTNGGQEHVFFAQPVLFNEGDSITFFARNVSSSIIANVISSFLFVRSV